MATLATATDKKVHTGADEKPERKPQRSRVDDKFKIFSGTANERLADDVCEFLGLTRNQAQVTRFKDGEAYVQIQENVRGADVFVIQPTSRPVDEPSPRRAAPMASISSMKPMAPPSLRAALRRARKYVRILRLVCP